MERESVQRLHAVVTDTAGVAGLVPTLKTSLSRLRQGRGSTPSDGGGADVSGDSLPVPAAEPSGDGVSITVHGDEVSVVLDIIATTGASVLTTALAVHAAASQFLEVTHPGRHSVTVNVLGLDQDDES